MAKLDKGKSKSAPKVEPVTPKNPSFNQSSFLNGLQMIQKIREKQLFLTLNSPLVFSLVFIISLFAIVNYLFHLKNCVCFEERNKEHKTNLNYLLSIDIILLVFYVFLFAAILYAQYGQLSLTGRNTMMIIQNLRTIYYVLFVVVAVLIILTFLFIFYIYKLSLSLDESCECSNSKLKYLLYAQGVLSSLFLIGLFVTVYNLLSIGG